MFGETEDPFALVKSGLKSRDDKILTENWIFSLHSKWSLIFSTIALTFISSYTAVLHKPIVCYGLEDYAFPKEFLDEWCWISGTYTIPQHIDKIPGKEVVFSGVGPDGVGTTRLYNTEYIFHPIVFLLQMCFFLASKCIWRHLEGGRLKTLLSEMTTAIIDSTTLKKRINLITNYMTTSPSTFHNGYAYRYIFCEIFNASNIILQLLAIDKILHEEFLSYGWVAISYLSSIREPGIRPPIVDPFTKLFPKLATCSFKIFGPSGSKVTLEALCILPMNSMAEKIFLAWWFWLVFLGFITVFGLIYRFLVFSKRFREIVFRIKTLNAQIIPADLRYIVDNSSYGDWFVLSLMQKNMDSWVFAQLVRELAIKIKDTKEKRL